MSIGAYRAVQISSLPREMWPSAAYSTLLTLIGRAERAIGNEDWQTANNALVRAQQIVGVLSGSLQGDSDLTARLRSLYAYIAGELGKANVSKDAARLAALVPVLLPLRDAWEQAGRSALKGEVPKGE